MGTTTKTTAPLTDAEYARFARMVDARTRPVVDRILAAHGLTRADLPRLARMAPAPVPPVVALADEPEAAPAPTPGATPRREARKPRE